MKAWRALSNVLCCALLLGLGLVGPTRVLAQSSASASCAHHQGDDQHGDSDDDDDNGEDDDPGDLWSSSWSGSFCGTATASSASSSSSGTARGGGSADISTGGSQISKGSIAGIVIAILVLLGLAACLLCFIRRRYTRRRRLANKPSLLGPTLVTSAHPAGTKEGAVADFHTQAHTQNEIQTMANVAPTQPPGLRLQRSPSRTSLPPQIPFDTPAYSSTDNLALPSHRASTVLSYASPSESTGVTAATAGHGSGYGYGVGYGHVNLHDGMLSRQKELETSYRRMEMGQVGEYLVSSPVSGSSFGAGEGGRAGTTESSSEHTAIPENLPENPPPQYKE